MACVLRRLGEQASTNGPGPAGRRAGALLSWLGPVAARRGEAEAVAVTEAVLVVATWRELLSCRLLSDVERDPPLWHCGLHGERRRRGGGLQSGLGVGGC